MRSPGQIQMVRVYRVYAELQIVFFLSEMCIIGNSFTRQNLASNHLKPFIPQVSPVAKEDIQ